MGKYLDSNGLAHLLSLIKNYIDSHSGSGGGTGADLPIGTVIDFAGATIPSDYLECDGSAISRTDYADLFAVLGTTWGAGDGSTTFNLPDLRGRVSIGAGTGTADGATAHALASAGGDERMQSHSHPHTIKATTPKFTHSISTTNGNKNLIGAGSQTSIGSAGANGSHYTYKQVSVDDHAATDCTMSGSVSSEGSGTAGNMQPFATVKKIIKAT